MDKNIKLLLVEDSVDDELLLIRTLKNSGLVFNYKRVETADSFTKELKAQNWDIIISDYALPNFSGRQALNITRSGGFDIPFIIVSGTIGEDIAVEMMRNGANDYIMKGNLTRLISAIERELKEAELRKFHKKVVQERDNIFNLSNDLICIIDFNGYFKQLNPAWERVLGFSLDELKAKPFLHFVHPDDRERTKEFFNVIINDRDSFTFENRYVCNDGNIRWMMWNGATLKSEELVFAIARDLTEIISSQQALDESEKKYKFLANNTLDVIWQLDMNLITRYLNPAIFNILGFKPEELIGKSLAEYCPKNELIRIQSVIQNMLEKPDGPKGVILELELIHKDGRHIPVEVHGSIIVNEDGIPLGLQGTTRDITERRNTQKELIHAKEKAEEANRLKSGFLAAMSHEIRTPLNAILGFNYVLREIFFGKSEPKIQKYFSYVEEAGKRLLTTISAILDLSRIEANEFSITSTKLSVTKTIMDTYNICKILAEQKGLRIDLDLPDKDFTLNTDEYCINGILTNILNNSIKYSEKGTIKISASENSDYAVFTISDEGIGMSEDYMKHLFETFSQENMGWNRKYEGSGLGLALTKRYIDLLKGKINIESKKNEGTTVTFEIPKAEL